MDARRIGVGLGFRLSPQPLLSGPNWAREFTPRVDQVLGRLHVAQDKWDLHALFSQQVWTQGQ